MKYEVYAVGSLVDCFPSRTEAYANVLHMAFNRITILKDSTTRWLLDQRNPQELSDYHCTVYAWTGKDFHYLGTSTGVYPTDLAEKLAESSIYYLNYRDDPETFVPSHDFEIRLNMR